MELKINIGKLLFIICPKSPWIKIEKMMPFNPESVLGLTPNWNKFNWRYVSAKKTIQHIIKNNKGNLITDNNSANGNFLIDES